MESDRGNGEEGVHHVDWGSVECSGEFSAHFILCDLKHVDEGNL